jgi:hypothetical protein
MPLPGSEREKKFLSEIAEAPKPEFLQEIKEPYHEESEQLVEQAPKRRRSRKKK